MMGLGELHSPCATLHGDHGWLPSAVPVAEDPFTRARRFPTRRSVLPLIASEHASGSGSEPNVVMIRTIEKTNVRRSEDGRCVIPTIGAAIAVG